MSTTLVERVEEVVAPRETTVADVLELAAYGYEEGLYDFCQKPNVEMDGVSPDGGSRCLFGAVVHAGASLDWDEGRESFYDIAAMAAGVPSVTSAVVGRPSVATWNDLPGRTKADVVTALRTAAEKARES